MKKINAKKIAKNVGLAVAGVAALGAAFYAGVYCEAYAIICASEKYAKEHPEEFEENEDSEET